MKIASVVNSKRAPNLVSGEIGDLDLCHALVVVWPLIAFGGLGPQQGVGSMARRVTSRPARRPWARSSMAVDGPEENSRSKPPTGRGVWPAETS